jgi:hypothetical protein
VWWRWSSGKDKVLQVCEGRFEARLWCENFSSGIVKEEVLKRLSV